MNAAPDPPPPSMPAAMTPWEFQAAAKKIKDKEARDIEQAAFERKKRTIKIDAYVFNRDQNDPTRPFIPPNGFAVMLRNVPRYLKDTLMTAKWSQDPSDNKTCCITGPLAMWNAERLLEYIEQQDKELRDYYPIHIAKHYAGKYWEDFLTPQEIEFASYHAPALSVLAEQQATHKIGSDPELLRDCELQACFGALDAAAAAHVATKAARQAATSALRCLNEERERDIADDISAKAADEESKRLDEEEVRNSDSTYYPQSPQQQSEQLAEPHATPESKQNKTEQTTTRTRRSRKRRAL